MCRTALRHTPQRVSGSPPSMEGATVALSAAPASTAPPRISKLVEPMPPDCSQPAPAAEARRPGPRTPSVEVGRAICPKRQRSCLHLEDTACRRRAFGMRAQGSLKRGCGRLVMECRAPTPRHAKVSLASDCANSTSGAMCARGAATLENPKRASDVARGRPPPVERGSLAHSRIVQGSISEKRIRTSGADVWMLEVLGDSHRATPAVDLLANFDV